MKNFLLSLFVIALLVLLSLGVVSSQDEFQDDVNNTISNVTTAIADIENTLSIDNETTTNTTTTTSSSENSGNMTTTTTSNGAEDTSTTLEPTTNSSSVPVTTTMTTTVNSTISPSVSSSAPATTSLEPSTNDTVTPTTSSTAPTQPPTTASPGRKFDGLSFIGGMILVGGLAALGFLVVRYLRRNNRLPYGTLH